MLFSDVAEYYDKLESTASRLSMIDILAEMLAKTDKDEIKPLIYMTQGVLAPPFEGIEIGMAEKLAEHAISIATGHSREEIYALYKKSGDLGTAAEQMIAKTKLVRMSQKKLHIKDIFESLQQIAKTSGSGSQDTKLKMFAGLLANSTPLAARYVTRFALGKLRLGLGDATILEALSKAFTGNREAKKQLEAAYNLCSDLGRVGDVIANKGIKGIEKMEITLFSPIRPQLAERVNTFEEIMEKMKGRCYVEAKYDGLRAQIHIDKQANKVEIFSRNLERLTEMFPEITTAALKEIKSKTAIIEGEMIAFNEDSDEFYSFQETIQRKRKHDVGEKSKQFPVKLFAFDIMYLDGKSQMNETYEKRHKTLESIILGGGVIYPSDRILSTTAKAVEKFFDISVGSGLEGIIAKDPESTYTAGARKFSWIKMKRSYRGELSDTVDLVIIGYYLGKGSRAEFGFGGLLTAVYNKKKDMFESVTRIGTGFTEEQMSFFKKELDKIRKSNKPPRVASTVEPDIWTDPKYVIEVRADEITKSPMHMCGKKDYEDSDEPGYALRFPRIVSDGFRDKKADDATTTEEIIELFGLQKKKKLEES